MKLFANKTLLFNNSEGDEFVAKIGFSEAPNWVGKTDLFTDALKDGSLKTFDSPTYSEAEKVMAAEEKAAYESKIAELEAKLAEKTTSTELDAKTPIVDKEDPEIAKLAPKKK